MTRLPQSLQTGTAQPREHRLQGYKQDLHQKLIAGMDLSTMGTLTEQELRQEVRQAAEEMCRLSSVLLNQGERERLVNEVLDETFGLGPLEILMRDATVSDILINGPSAVFIERRGRLEQVPIVFNDQHHLIQIIQRIVGRVGRRVDENSPMVDARLPDGSRINAVLPPLALDGPLVSIRRFGTKALLMNDLTCAGALTEEMALFLAPASAPA